MTCSQYNSFLHISSQANIIFQEDISCLWKKILEKMEFPKKGVIIEIGPGFKSKIGKALAAHGFRGEYHIIEPNADALQRIMDEYSLLLPDCTLIPHNKKMHEITIGKEIPFNPEALLGNHIFDDMVLSKSFSKVQLQEFFAMNSGEERIKRTKELWDLVKTERLREKITEVSREISAWMSALRPLITIFSHYGSRTLQRNKITKPTLAGKKIAQKIMKNFSSPLLQPYAEMITRAGYEKDWIIKDERKKDFKSEMIKSPLAFDRLHPSIFCKEFARRLKNSEYEVVYTNNPLLQSLGLISGCQTQREISKEVGKYWGIILDKKGKKEVFSDRQSDFTGIAMEGNLGSGRACYTGSNFNIKGIGRTQLATQPPDSLHGSGRVALETALREAVMSEFICKKTSIGTSPILAVIALKKRSLYPWFKNPLQDALIVRLDKGALDRISHRSYSALKREIDLNLLIEKYARFDAEMFAHRILHGAWSTGNTSLEGLWLDIESVSIISGRGARCSITKKYLSNYFGYEEKGIKQALRQLIEFHVEDSGNHALQGVNPRASKARTPLPNLGFQAEVAHHAFDNPIYKEKSWEEQFDSIRAHSLAYELLRLIGIEVRDISKCLNKFPQVYTLAAHFEDLAKKISPRNANLSVFYTPEKGTHLLDFSKLWREFPQHYQKDSSLKILKRILIRNKELTFCSEEKYDVTNSAQEFLSKNAVITADKLNHFYQKIDFFLCNFLKFIREIEKGGYLPSQKKWKRNALLANKEFPSFYQLTRMIRRALKAYGEGKITSQQLNDQMQALCKK